jgi:hypothetical protein
MQACRKTIRQRNPTRSWSSRPSLHSVTSGEHRLTAAAEQLGFSLGSLMRFLADKRGHNEFDARHSQSLRVWRGKSFGFTHRPTHALSGQLV